MEKYLRHLLFPLFILNVTISANGWMIGDLPIGVLLYWMTIAAAFAVAWETPYRFVATAALTAALALFVVERFIPAAAVGAANKAALSVVFLIAGAKIYGNHPGRLQRHFVVFLALSIPVMLLQMTGAHSFFMLWNTEYAHSTEVLDPTEIGSLKKIPVYPTLFVQPDDLYYQIGQGRPSGLLYSNNVLSVFVGIAAAINVGRPRRKRLGFGDLVVTLALVLTMSLNAYASALIVYAAVFVLGAPWRRRLATKLVLLLLALAGVYRIIFPGLFAIIFSWEKFSGSILIRGEDLARALGLQSAMEWLHAQREAAGWGSVDMENESYSLYAILLKKRGAVPLLAILSLVAVVYWRLLFRMRQVTREGTIHYLAVIVACAATQVGVPYAGAASFQFILGFALFPFFTLMWMRHHENVEERVSAEPALDT